MAIQLTPEEQKLFREGKLNIEELTKERHQVQTKPLNLNELDKLKDEIKLTNLEYKEAIQRNKDLYQELDENRKRKEELRNKLSDLRSKKKQMLGLN